MTGTPAHGREPIERWLASQHRDLRDSLDQLLDPGAGLREAMLHAEHASLLHDLDGTLDVEVGLAAIVPPAAATAPTAPQREDGQPDTAGDRQARIPQTNPPAAQHLGQAEALIRARDGRPRPRGHPPPPGPREPRSRRPRGGLHEGEPRPAGGEDRQHPPLLSLGVRGLGLGSNGHRFCVDRFRVLGELKGEAGHLVLGHGGGEFREFLETVAPLD